MCDSKVIHFRQFQAFDRKEKNWFHNLVSTDVEFQSHTFETTKWIGLYESNLLIVLNTYCWFPLSRFLEKILWLNKPAMKKFRKKIFSSESTLNCRSHHSRIKLTHTTKVVWETRSIILTVGLYDQLCDWTKQIE